MSKNLLKIIFLFILGIGGGIFADQILWPYFVERPLFHQYKLDQNPVYVTEIREFYIQENTALKEAVEKVEKTVVGIRTQTKTGKFLEGSGLIITSDGLMITLAELVPQGATFKFFIDGKNPSFQVLKRDLKENLALIKLEESILPTLSFADPEKLKSGERVFLVGVLLDKNDPFKAVNEGIVRVFDEDSIKTNISESYLLNGSPLFNIEGEILGINFVDFEGKIITIPISKIREFVEI